MHVQLRQLSPRPVLTVHSQLGCWLNPSAGPCNHSTTCSLTGDAAPLVRSCSPASHPVQGARRSGAGRVRAKTERPRRADDAGQDGWAPDAARRARLAPGLGLVAEEGRREREREREGEARVLGREMEGGVAGNELVWRLWTRK